MENGRSKNERENVYAIFLHYFHSGVLNEHLLLKESPLFVSEQSIEHLECGSFKPLITVQLIYLLKSISFIIFIAWSDELGLG